MSDPTTDPTHPDFVVPTGEGVASKDEIANAVAHVKAWFARELAKLEGKPLPPAPGQGTIEPPYVPTTLSAPAPPLTPPVATAEPDPASG